MTKADVKKLISYWMTLSESDWKAAVHLCASRSYVQSLFFVHLALEKLLKAMIVRASSKHAPYGHDLVYLLGKTGLDCPEQIIDKLRVIGTFNMESRYPDENLSFHKKANKIFCDKWIDEGKMVRKWLAQRFDAM